jgi:hypothetical protein
MERLPSPGWPNQLSLLIYLTGWGRVRFDGTLGGSERRRSLKYNLLKYRQKLPPAKYSSRKEIGGKISSREIGLQPRHYCAPPTHD